MADNPQDLKLRDVMVHDRPHYGPGNAITSETVVTYYVGAHGPFTDVYPAPEYTPEKARAAMEARMAGLHTLLAGTM